jgi:hypothetical protein
MGCLFFPKTGTVTPRPQLQSPGSLKLDFLDCLKAVAERAKLDEDNFWLHKFRATFATRCLWAGVDLRTVQQWLGHSDMESTMRYLKPSRSQQVREKVNEIFALVVVLTWTGRAWHCAERPNTTSSGGFQLLQR